MGLHVSYSIYPEAAQESVVWGYEEDAGASISRVGTTEGVPDSGRSYAKRSCAYVH